MAAARSTSDNTPPRRHAICEAVLDLAAAGGNRAVTHHAVDDRLGIARGSTSYYYRTRHDLLTAAITHLTAASRDAFHTALDTPAEPADPLDRATELVVGQLDLLLGDRRRDALARYALAADTAGNDDLRGALAVCLFSPTAAESLLTTLGADDPARAARDLVSLLEGLLFDRLHGARSLLGLTPGTPAGRADLRPAIRRWLAALSGRG
ncbi:TetR/AcrR family transcriptional regulator [Nocardia blacklockiae]|uniref:TetR/AcrR family transcriptional regulator n=1 Tax=Nocardia blacklockiae TaxID=480036 RepID=UPI001893CE0B|nr:TetR family transcriptional regulator [Nocardia blacklockiae]MBF6169947.1 TetR family transcriptional regulator [Nocardia blacklockiae]